MRGARSPDLATPRSVPAGRGDGESDLRWLWRLWGLLAVIAVPAVVRSREVDIPFRDPHGAILRDRLALSAALLVVLVVADTGVRAWHSGRGASGFSSVLRRRWTLRRTAGTVAALTAYHLVYFCYHNLKSWDVLNPPRDRMLLHWDRWLFLGHDPAVLLHDLLGQHVAAYTLMVVYESFSTLMSVSVVAAVALAPDLRDGCVFVASAMWVWILGVGSYYLIPSLGPFHSDPAAFARLPRTMIQSTQARYLAQRTQLLADPHARDAFAQISAFASLHVAVTSMILLMAAYYRLRSVTYAMALFLLATITATVYLGWHYAVDDVAGLLIAGVGVALGKLTIHPDGRAGRGGDARSAGS